MKEKLLKFGFEIEGEFTRGLRTKIADMGIGDIKGDGSVQKCYQINGEQLAFHKKWKDKEHITSEFASVPFVVPSKLRMNEFFKTLQKEYELGNYHWNESAGFHIHTSFEPKIPMSIFSLRFSSYFLDKLAEKFPSEFNSRRNNRYCKVKIGVADLVRKYSSYGGHNSFDRYKAINFIPAMQRHGTVEFRIFPANEPKKMKEYLDFTFKTIQDFLETEADKLNFRKNCYVDSNNKPVEYINEEVSGNEVGIINEVFPDSSKKQYV